MKETPIGITDGVNPAFTSPNEIHEHLLFVDRACQIYGVDYVTPDLHSIQFLSGAIPRPLALIHLVHLK